MRIAVYAPCKNEEKFVEQWLRMSEDADIRIVGDTGSTDNTLNMLYDHMGKNGKLHVHRVRPMPFRFDTARNTILSLVPPDIDICIACDFDEQLAPGWREILERRWSTANLAWVTYTTDGLKPFLHNCRIHSRSGWVWRDPCHEGLYEFGIEKRIVVIPELVINAKGQDKSKPRTQYLTLLALGINEEPWNTRRIFYYARELMVYQHFEKAIGWFLKYVELRKQTDLDMSDDEFKQAQMYLQVCEGALEELRTGVKQKVPTYEDRGL